MSDDYLSMAELAVNGGILCAGMACEELLGALALALREEIRVLECQGGRTSWARVPGGPELPVAESAALLTQT